MSNLVITLQLITQPYCPTKFKEQGSLEEVVIQVTHEIVLEVVIQEDLDIIMDIMEEIVLDLVVLVVLDLVVLVVLDLVEELVVQEQVALGLEGLLLIVKFLISEDILRKLVLRQCNAMQLLQHEGSY